MEELREHFSTYLDWGKTPSMSECSNFLKKHPHPEKGRIAHDIQDKVKRMIQDKKSKK